VNKTLLPLISTEILTSIGDENEFKDLHLSIGPKGEFVTEFH
jgi:hypothetical protein